MAVAVAALASTATPAGSESGPSGPSGTTFGNYSANVRASAALTLTVFLPMASSPPPTPTPTRTPTATVTPTCPVASANVYAHGAAQQYDQDDPVRPAWNHADKNLKMRSYAPNTDPSLIRGLVGYGSDDPSQPPQLATLFSPSRVPAFGAFHRVHEWNWAPSPAPGTRGAPLTQYRVTAMGLRTNPGEPLRVPTSNYDIGEGMEVIVLFADERTIAFRYGRQDSSGARGFTVHVDNICTDPNLLALYDTLDAPTGPRYQYVGDGYSYSLPSLPAGQQFGTSRGSEIVVAVTDSGTFLDPRSCNEWWQQRPGYTGGCPWHD